MITRDNWVSVSKIILQKSVTCIQSTTVARGVSKKFLVSTQELHPGRATDTRVWYILPGGGGVYFNFKCSVLSLFAYLSEYNAVTAKPIDQFS